MVVPAVGLGLVAVFVVGAGIAYGVLSFFESRSWGNLSEKGRDRLAIVGGVVSVVLLVLLMAKVPKWMPVIWIALTVIGILAGLATFAMNGSDGGAQKRPEPGSGFSARGQPAPQYPGAQGKAAEILPPPRESDYTRLLVKAHGDRGLADRLVEYERRRNPSVSFDELCKTAVERWERDNR